MVTYHSAWGQVSMGDAARGSTCIYQRLADLAANAGYYMRHEWQLQQGSEIITLNIFLNHVQRFGFDDKVIKADNVGMRKTRRQLHCRTIDRYMGCGNSFHRHNTLQYLVYSLIDNAVLPLFYQALQQIAPVNNPACFHNLPRVLYRPGGPSIYRDVIVTPTYQPISQISCRARVTAPTILASVPREPPTTCTD